MRADCKNAVDKLKEGPANIPEVITLGEKYTDSNFGGNKDDLFWQEYMAEEAKASIEALKEEEKADEVAWRGW